MNPSRLMIVLLLNFILMVGSLYSQMDCQVNVNMEQIPGSVRDRIQSFASDLQNYINFTKWTTEDLGGEKIKCTINIFLLSVSGENDYSAQIFIGSQRPIYVGKNPSERFTAMVRLFDDKWDFTYLKNQPLIHDENRFDALISMIDFYINLIIGFDYDSYDPLSGTPYFQKAQTICNQAPGSATGWQRNYATYNRYALVEELLTAKYQQFREGLFQYHVKGIDLLATKKETGLKNIATFVQQAGDIKKMVNPRSLLVKSFFDTKYMELAEIFRDYQDRSVYQLLSKVDPAHESTYLDAMKN